MKISRVIRGLDFYVFDFCRKLVTLIKYRSSSQIIFKFVQSRIYSIVLNKYHKQTILKYAVDTIYNFSSDWFSYKIPPWIKCVKYPKNRHLRVLEIGSFEGRSTVFILTNWPNSRIDCVDPWLDYAEVPFKNGMGGLSEKNFDFNTRKFNNRIMKYKLKSTDFFSKSTLSLYDIVYIDGLHLASSVFSDATNSHFRLRVGGYMIFDDYFWAFYSNYKEKTIYGVNQFIAVYGKYYSIKFIDAQLIIKKIVDTNPLYET